MANIIPAAAIASANEINSDTAWLVLLEVIFDSAEDDRIRVCRNTENIIWGGKTWVAFPFEISETKVDDKGTLSNLTLDVDNSSRDLEYHLNKYAGGSGCQIVLRVVRSDDLSCPTPDLEEYFSVKATTVTESKVSFTLGNAYPAKARRPYRRYMKNNCPFKYKGVMCGASSSHASCNHTLKDCRARGNSTRFGGFPGIPQGGLYV